MPSVIQRLAGVFRMPRMRPYSGMGTTGTPVFGGYVHERERSSKWVGQQKYISSADLAVNTSIVAAGVHHFLNLVAHPHWAVRPADDSSPEARELAEFTEAVLHDLDTPWSRVVRRAGLYRFHGFSLQEWTAVRRDDGRTGLRDVETRPQHTIEQWVVAEDGSVEGVFQRSPQTGRLLPLPRRKLVYLVEDTLTDSPEGLGMFRHLADPWERLKTYLDLETKAFERDLRGIPIGRIPYTRVNEMVANSEITEENAKAMVEAMEEFVKLAVKQSDTGLTLDSMPYESVTQDGTRIASVPQWGLDLLQGSGSGLGELAAAINRTQLEMARVISAEHLMMGGDAASGNRSLSEDKSRNLYLVANAVLSNIAAAFEHDLVGVLWTLNGFPDELRPTLEPEDVTFKDAEAVASVLRSMAQAGAMLDADDPVVGDVRDLMGVSRPEPVSPEMAGMVGTREADGEAGGEPTQEEEREEEFAQRRGGVSRKRLRLPADRM